MKAGARGGVGGCVIVRRAVEWGRRRPELGVGK